MTMFITGAGFTKALFPHAPLNSELLKVLEEKYPTSVYSDLRSRYGTDKIEILLTKLDSEDSSANRLIRERIETELAHYFREFSFSEDCLRDSPWLTRFAKEAVSPGDVIVNLNYDCSLEGALDWHGKWSANGGYGRIENPLTVDQQPSAVKMLKIHGSANFIIAPHADVHKHKSIGFEFSEKFFPRSAKHAVFGYGAGGGRSYIIAPSYIKIPTAEIAYLMLYAIREAGDAEKMVVIGSSLRSEDSALKLIVTNFFQGKNWKKRKMIVVDPYADSIGKSLKNYWNDAVSEQICLVCEGINTGMDSLLEAIRD